MTHTRPATRVRKNQCKLTDKEWDCLISAMKSLKAKKTGKDWDWYVTTHEKHASDGHGGHHFLPWHRRFILDFENSLREFEPTVTLPYWNAVAERDIPKQFHAKVLGWMHVSRAIIRKDSTLPSMDKLESARASRTFEGFTHSLENRVHNDVHNWVGGDMADPRKSPKDPLFFLHHAYMDKVWTSWQARTGVYDEPHPDETLEPWGATIASVMRASSLGYEYE